METSTKSQNEQQKAIKSNKRHLPVLVFEIELILSQKQERATKGNELQMETCTKNQNEQQEAKKSLFHSHFHSFAPILDLWKVVDIKSNEKPERATKSSEKQQKATKSNKKQQRTSELEKPKQARKSQDEQRRAQKSKWKPGLTD